MGTYYEIYAEVKIKDKWYNINPFIRGTNGDLRLVPIYSWASSFRSTFEELANNAYSRGLPSDISEDVKAKFAFIEYNNSEWLKANFQQWNSEAFTIVNFGKTITKRLLPNRKTRYAGYVYKQTIIKYELDEIDEIYEWLTAEEYQQLDEKEKIQYGWYEWNDMDDWYDHYVSISQAVRMQLNYFKEHGFYQYDSKDFTYDDMAPSDTDVRLIVYKSVLWVMQGLF